MLTRIQSRFSFVMVTALLMASVCCAQSPATSSSKTSTEPVMAPEAIAALEKMGGFLRTLKAFTVRADTDIDEVLDDTGQKLQFGTLWSFTSACPIGCGRISPRIANNGSSSTMATS